MHHVVRGEGSWPMESCANRKLTHLSIERSSAICQRVTHGRTLKVKLRLSQFDAPFRRLKWPSPRQAVEDGRDRNVASLRSYSTPIHTPHAKTVLPFSHNTQHGRQTKRSELVACISIGDLKYRAAIDVRLQSKLKTLA